MNMKKLLTIAMITLAIFVVKADVTLYWTVAEDAWSGASKAVLFGDNAGTYVPVAIAALGVEVETEFSGVSASPYTNYFVKLYSESMSSFDDALATSASSVYYESLMAYMWDKNDPQAEPPASPYSFMGFVIPEPTSGLLFLLGFAALSLKRRV